MTEDLKNRIALRRYLSGNLTDENELRQIEERLLLDDDAFQELHIVEDELIDDYLAGKLDEAERENFEQHFISTPEREQRFKFASALKTYIADNRVEETARVVETRATKSHWLKSVFASPLKIAFAALLVFVAVIGVWRAFFYQSELDKSLIALNAAYHTQRPFEARITDLDYAPLSNTRGSATEAIDDRALRRAENSADDAVSAKGDATSHHALGRVYLAKRIFDKAVEQFETALKTDANNARIHSDLGTALLEIGNTAQLNNEPAQSLDALSKSLEQLNKALELDKNLNEALFNKALSLQSMKLNGQAKEAWQQYLARDPNSKWADEARRNLQKLSEQKSSSKTATQLLQDFLAAYRARDDEQAWLIISQNREMITGKFIEQQLINEFLSAENKSRKETSDEILPALLYAGELGAKRTGDFFFTELANYYAASSARHRALLAKAHAATDAGYSLCKAAQYKEALNKFTAAKVSFVEAGDELEAQKTDYWIAYCLSLSDKIEGSQSRLKAVIEFSKPRNYKWLQSQALCWLANNYYLQSEYSKSIDYNNQALEIAESISDSYNTQKILSQLAGVYRELNQMAKSLDYHQRSLTLANRPFSSARQTWRNLSSSAQTFYTFKRFNVAAAYEQEALRLGVEELQDPSLNHFTYISLGIIYGGMGHYYTAPR